MSIERTSEGWELRVRPSGIRRYFIAAAITVWLCLWLGGEVMALWLLNRLALPLLGGNTGSVPAVAVLGVVAFLVVWITGWTVGGFFMMQQWLFFVSSEERLTVTTEGVRIARRRGPWTFVRTIPRGDVTRVRVAGRYRKLTLDTPRKSIAFAAFPVPGEVELAVRELARELNLADDSGESLPEGWVESISPEGDRIVTSRAALGHGIEIVVGKGRLIWQRRSGTTVDEVFVAHRIELEYWTDPHGNEWHRLIAVWDPAGNALARERLHERLVMQAKNDPLLPAALGAWLARNAAVPLDPLRKGPSELPPRSTRPGLTPT